MTPASKTTSHSSKPAASATGRLARHRRPGWIAAGAGLTAFAVLTNVYLFRSAGERVAVVRLARDVPVGRPLTAADLNVARVAVDETTPTIPGRQLQQVVGKRSAVGLRKGTLLAASELTAQASPGHGQALVTVPLKASSVPPGLAPGWRVRAVFTTSAQDRAAGGAASLGDDRLGGPATAAGDVPGVVDEVTGPDAEGSMSVSLLVDDSTATTVARQAAAGLVVLVVTERLG
jgi:hypothetical protein